MFPRLLMDVDPTATVWRGDPTLPVGLQGVKDLGNSSGTRSIRCAQIGGEARSTWGETSEESMEEDLHQQNHSLIKQSWNVGNCVKSMPPTAENWLRKLYTYSKKNYKSTED